MITLSGQDKNFMQLAIRQAERSRAMGGIPIGAALARGSELLSEGHNERVQNADPIAHGEIACFRNAGRQSSYASTTLYTTLSPCQMCSGAILLFRVPRLVVGEAKTFAGDLNYLMHEGVEVVLLNDPKCIDLMTRFRNENPELWSEDIGGR
jgi:cytosine deaminase